MAKASEFTSDGSRSPRSYFEQIRRCAGLIPLNVFATANNRFSLDFAALETHLALEREFLNDSTRAKLLRLRRRRLHEPLTIVFTRAGALLNIKLLLGTVRPDNPYRPTAVGACALHANDFVESLDTSALRSGLLPAVAEFAATWELQNPREPAPLLRRSYYIYDRLLRTSSAIRAFIDAELHVPVEHVYFGGLPFSSYFPLLFGLYTVAVNAVRNEATSIVDARDVAAKAKISTDQFVAFAELKARSILDSEREFGLIDAPADFRSRVEDIRWVSDALPFRDRPLLAMPNGTYMVLDVQLLFENASAGLFWNFMNQLPSRKARHTFSGHWGKVFERYVQDLVRHYFPAVESNVTFDGGDLDLFLRAGSDALAFEVKSGFLAQHVKASRSGSVVGDELRKKFVVDDDGGAKGVRQLAIAIRALREQKVARTVDDIRRIYPVLVVEDPVMQTIAMNAYLNELFEQELDRNHDVAPLTVLLIDELEELLPHVHAGDFSWPEIFGARLVGGKVVAYPMHTTLSELGNEKRLPIRQDTFLKSHGDELMAMISSAYEKLLGRG